VLYSALRQEEHAPAVGECERGKHAMRFEIKYPPTEFEVRELLKNFATDIGNSDQSGTNR
jgi:hypothetical protein